MTEFENDRRGELLPAGSRPARRRIDEGPTGAWGLFLMTAFFVPFIWFAPKLLTAIYLVVTFGVIGIIGKIRRETFRHLVFNNDWVILSVLGMFLVSWIMAGLNPLVPRDLIRGLWDSLWGIPELPTTRNFVSAAFWRTVNWTFFGEWQTRGWSDATGFYLIWLIPALFVSKWDESIEISKSLFTHRGKGFLNFFLKDGLSEIVRKLLGIRWVVILGAIVASLATTGCGRNLESELQALQNKPVAETSEEAKILYDEVEKFVHDLEEYKASGGEVPTELVVRATALRAQRAAQRGVAAVREGRIWATVKSWFNFGGEGGNNTPLTPEEKLEKMKKKGEELGIDIFSNKPPDPKRWP